MEIRFIQKSVVGRWSSVVAILFRVIANDARRTANDAFCLLHHPPSRIVPQHWSGKEQGIDAIQHASMARQNGSRILDSGSALDQRLHQIAELGRDVDGR